MGCMYRNLSTKGAELSAPHSEEQISRTNWCEGEGWILEIIWAWWQ